MKFISPHDRLGLTLKKDTPKGFEVVRQPFWVPYDLRKDEAMVEYFGEEEDVTPASVLSKLDDECDGFQAGVEINIKAASGKETHLMHLTPAVYIPGDRCEVAGFKAVEEVSSDFAIRMILSGTKEVLRVPNGFLPMDSDNLYVVGMLGE